MVRRKCKRSIHQITQLCGPSCLRSEISPKIEFGRPLKPRKPLNYNAFYNLNVASRDQFCKAMMTSVVWNSPGLLMSCLGGLQRQDIVITYQVTVRSYVLGTRHLARLVVLHQSLTNRPPDHCISYPSPPAIVPRNGFPRKARSGSKRLVPVRSRYCGGAVAEAGP